MKKLIIMVLPIAIGLAVFTASCTPLSVEEEYEIQVIDKDEIQHPDERGKNNPKDPK